MRACVRACVCVYVCVCVCVELGRGVCTSTGVVVLVLEGWGWGGWIRVSGKKGREARQMEASSAGLMSMLFSAISDIATVCGSTQSVLAEYIHRQHRSERCV